MSSTKRGWRGRGGLGASPRGLGPAMSRTEEKGLPGQGVELGRALLHSVQSGKVQIGHGVMGSHPAWHTGQR